MLVQRTPPRASAGEFLMNKKPSEKSEGSFDCIIIVL